MYIYNPGTSKHNIRKGSNVDIVLKKDQRSGILTNGHIKDILTSSREHHRGLKVRLHDGQVGRVQRVNKF